MLCSNSTDQDIHELPLEHQFQEIKRYHIVTLDLQDWIGHGLDCNQLQLEYLVVGVFGLLEGCQIVQNEQYISIL